MVLSPKGFSVGFSMLCLQAFQYNIKIKSSKCEDYFMKSKALSHTYTHQRWFIQLVKIYVS